MYASQAISRCAGCAAQTARSATLQQEMYPFSPQRSALRSYLGKVGIYGWS